MKRFVLLAATTLSLSACGSDKVTDPDEPPTVSMPGFSFVPFTTTVPVGGTVIFDFPAEPHNVIFQKLTGAPQDIQETVNAKVSRTFSVSGTFPYDCTIHPGMSGVIEVH